MKVTIHTTLSEEHIFKLKKYGFGLINRGIENIIDIAESKQRSVWEELEKIARIILIRVDDKK